MTRARPSVTFLVMWPDHVGGTELATLQVARRLASWYDVTVLGIVRDRDVPFFDAGDVPVRHLVDRRTEAAALDAGAAGLEVDDAATLDREPTTFVDPTWERSLSALAERALGHALARDRPDVVVATTPTLLALATRLAPEESAVIAVEHRSTVHRGRSGVALRECAARADAVVVLTPEGAVWLEALLGASAPHVAVIGNMLPDRLVVPSPLTAPVVVAAGRHAPGKQFDDLINAFAPVAAANPEWVLRIFGDGPTTPILRRAIRRLGLHDNVQLVPPVPDLPLEMNRASVLAMSSSAEGFPLVMLEAIAAGLPIVSYDCPFGPRHLVEHGVTGLLARTGDVDDLADALLRVVADDALRRRLGEGARSRRAMFDPEVVAARWHALLDDVVGRRDQQPSRHDRIRARIDAAAAVRPPIDAMPAVDPVTELQDLLGAATDALQARGLPWATGAHGDELLVAAADAESFLAGLEGVAILVTPDSTPTRWVHLRADVHPVAAVLRSESGVWLSRRPIESVDAAIGQAVRVRFVPHADIAAPGATLGA